MNITVTNGTEFFPGNVVEGFMEVNCCIPTPVIALRIAATGGETDTTPTPVIFYEHCVNICGMTRQQEQGAFNAAGQPIMVGQAALSQALLPMPMTPSILFPAGKYVFPFSFLLPQNLPPSYLGDVGLMQTAGCQYVIKGSMSILSDPPVEFFATVKVLSMMSDTTYSQLQSQIGAPRNRDDYAVRGCCCSQKGTVNCEVRLDKGVVATDREPLSLDVAVDCTLSRATIKGVKVELTHFVTQTVVPQRDLACRIVKSMVVPCQVAPGQSSTVKVVMPLDRSCPATAVLSRTRSRCVARVTLQTDGMFVSNVVAHDLPVMVGHAVVPGPPDMSFPQPGPELGLTLLPVKHRKGLLALSSISTSHHRVALRNCPCSPYRPTIACCPPSCGMCH